MDPQGQINELCDERKPVIADALEAAVGDMTTTKQQPTPKVNVTANGLNDAKSVQVLQTIVNAAVPIRVVKNTFTNVTQFPTIGHLLDDIRAEGSFVTLTDMTQDALQVQELNLDALRVVGPVKELTKVPECELVDIKVEEELDFEAEHAKLTEPEQLEVKVNESLDFEAEHTKLAEPELLQIKEEKEEEEVENIVDMNTTFEEHEELEDDCDNVQDGMSITSHTDSNDKNDDDEPMSTHTQKYNVKRKRVINVESLLLFICPECGYYSENFDDWKDHTNKLHQFNTVEKINMRSVQTIHKGKLGFECGKCSKRYTRVNSSSEELITHHMLHLPFKNYLRCRLCQQHFSILRCAKRHLRLMHPLDCAAVELNINEQHISPMSYISIHCPICNKEQPDIEHWNKHLKLQHDFFTKCAQQVTNSADDQYECSICLKHIRKANITDHVLHHEPYKPFQCTICKTFVTIRRGAALEHVRNVHLLKKRGIEALNCNYCDATFTSGKSLYYHNHKFHKEELKQSYGSCKACNMGFTNLSQLVAHLHSARHIKNSK